MEINKFPVSRCARVYFPNRNFWSIFCSIRFFCIRMQKWSIWKKTYKIIISYAEVQSFVKLIIRKGVCCLCEIKKIQHLFSCCLSWILFFCFVDNIIRTFITVNGWVAFTTLYLCLCDSLHVSNVFAINKYPCSSAKAWNVQMNLLYNLIFITVVISTEFLAIGRMTTA